MAEKVHMAGWMQVLVRSRKSMNRDPDWTIDRSFNEKLLPHQETIDNELANERLSWPGYHIVIGRWVLWSSRGWPQDILGSRVIIGILYTFPGTSDDGKSRCNTGWIPYVFLRRSRRKFSGVRLNRDDYTSDGIRKHLSLDVIVIMKIMMTWWWLTVLSAYTVHRSWRTPRRRLGDATAPTPLWRGFAKVA